MYDRDQLQNVLTGIKRDFEGAIEDPDDNPNYSMIRSQELIGRIHSFIIDQLENNGIEESRIHEDEVVYGYPKSKSQDILVHDFDSRRPVVGPHISINVRSQLSSIGKNYDTIYERIFAESTSLHNRFPYLPLGYFFLLPKRGYDSDAKNDNRIERSEEYDIEKYIDSFASISGREDPNDNVWKYEAICLLIVDFSQDPPMIMDNIDYYVEEGIVSADFAETYGSKIISVDDFFDKLIRDYKRRYALVHDFSSDRDDPNQDLSGY
ncbi:hypothetical protein GLW36_11740 [Halorubrum terrestre]|uniref:Restriction endonuclease n=1 Tax=Halorubrum distributum TaxID=29283 RepID=A0A6B1IDL2_9EURY|nr:hypothetical protein [Halorubrum terrestre]MYL17309.1 hypothetical protein [Halorubrum terrestre]